MCTRQGNFLLHLNIPCLRECKMPELHDTTLLSAPIFALPNCFGPGFLRMACPLSLSLPQLHVRPPPYDPPPPSSCGSLLALCCASPLAAPRASFGANVLQPILLFVPMSFACCDCTVSNHCIKSQRGGGDFVQHKLES